MARLDQLYELQRRLNRFQVFDSSEVEAVAAARNQVERLHLLDPVLARFLEMYEPAQEDFRNVLSAFVQLYSFESQPLASADPEIEKLSAFGHLLLTRLPDPAEREKLEVREEVTLESDPWKNDVRETDLLRKIRRELPPETNDRYRALMERRRAETLTDAEHSELIRLSDKSEQLQAERLESLADLAHLRRISFATLVRDLDFRPHRNA